MNSLSSTQKNKLLVFSLFFCEKFDCVANIQVNVNERIKHPCSGVSHNENSTTQGAVNPFEFNYLGLVPGDGNFTYSNNRSVFES